MTLLELTLFFALAALLYFGMRPIQRRLERALLKFFRSVGGDKGVVIDITDYTKETIPKDKN